MPHQILLRICLAFSLLCLSNPILYALESDKTAKIFLTADSVQIDRIKRIAIYTGNVHFTRGSSSIVANKIIVYTSQQDKLIKAIALGSAKNRVIYKTIPANNKAELTALAEKMTYNAITHTVHMQGQVDVQQDHNQITSGALDYNTETGAVITKQLKPQGQRTEITLENKDFK